MNIIEDLRSLSKSKYEYENRATGMTDLLDSAADTIERLSEALQSSPMPYCVNTQPSSQEWDEAYEDWWEANASKEAIEKMLEG